MTKVELYKSRVFLLIIHLFATGHFTYALYYTNFDVDRSLKLKTSKSLRLIPNSTSQKALFLTYWNLIIQATYYIISLINDVVGTNEIMPKKRPFIRRLKDYIMATLAFPVALNVGITFWSLYAVNRELVFPKVLDPVFPSWLNHIMHTNIMVFIFMELCTSYRPYPKRANGLAGLSIFMLSYLVWIHIVKHYSGVWVYPVLEVLMLPQRIIFFVSVLALTSSLYFLGEYLNRTIWEKELKIAQRKSK